jgi:hypothetical protein
MFTKQKQKKNLVLTFVIIFLMYKASIKRFLELDIFVIFTNTEGIFYYYFWRKWSEQALYGTQRCVTIHLLSFCYGNRSK